ncbi:MAG: hypothetical protein QXX17_01775 [Conexivisphaerales archaeon]
MRILITGFEAWAGNKNPSGMVAEELNGSVIDGAEVVGKVLPEDFYALPKLARKLVDEVRPDCVISTGWDYTKAIRVEKVALNVMNSFFADSVVPDNYGNKPRDEPIIKGGPLALGSTLPADEIVKELNDAGIPAILSYHAGTHCCNTAMYSFLHADIVKISGFIHVPPLPDMIKNPKIDTITMPIGQQKRAIEIAVRVCARHLSSLR